jgi:hypothetical protein
MTGMVKDLDMAFWSYFSPESFCSFLAFSANKMSRLPFFRLRFMSSIKIYVWAVQFWWNFPGSSRSSSSSFRTNSSQNLEFGVSIESSVCEAKVSRFDCHFSMARALSVLSRNRSLYLLILPSIPSFSDSNSRHFPI